MKTDIATTNFYEVIYKLESFRKDINETNNTKEIEKFILQLKSYIFSVKELKDTYIQRVNSYADFLLQSKESSKNSSKFLDVPYKKFIEEFEHLYLDELARESAKFLYSTDTRFTYYYRNITDNIDIREYVKQCSKQHIGVINLYRDMNPNRMDKHFIQEYKKVLEAVDFFVLKFFDGKYNCPFGQKPPIANLYAFDRNPIQKDFMQLYIKSVCNGVIHGLCIEISKNFIAKYYNETVQDVQNDLPLELLNLTEQERKVYYTFYQNPQLTVWYYRP